MTANAGQLVRCPVCRYDLSGLPAEHRCPECGFEYDKTMRAWDPPPIRWRLHAVLILLVLFLGLPVLDRLFLGLGRPLFAGKFGSLLLFIWTAPLLSGAVFVFRRLRGQRSVVLTDRGLLLVGPSRCLTTLAWHHVWVPKPAGKRQVQPWVTERNRELEDMSWLECFFCRQRGVRAVRFTVYQPPGKRSEYPFGRPTPLSIRYLPRPVRLAAMTDVYERWRRATQKGPDSPDAVESTAPMP